MNITERIKNGITISYNYDTKLFTIKESLHFPGEGYTLEEFKELAFQIDTAIEDHLRNNEEIIK